MYNDDYDNYVDAMWGNGYDDSYDIPWYADMTEEDWEEYNCYQSWGEEEENYE